MLLPPCRSQSAAAQMCRIGDRAKTLFDPLDPRRPKETGYRLEEVAIDTYRVYQPGEDSDYLVWFEASPFSVFFGQETGCHCCGAFSDLSYCKHWLGVAYATGRPISQSVSG
jgi:hypothetical protein